MTATIQIAVILLLVLLGSCGDSALAQQITSVRVLEVRPAGSGMVQVFASVHNAEGRHIEGLGTANFVATVGAEHAAADSVGRIETGGVPMSVILLLDSSGSMRRSMGSLREAASAFVQQLGPEDLCSVMTFGNGVKTIAAFTADKSELLRKLTTLQAANLRPTYTKLSTMP